MCLELENEPFRNLMFFLLSLKTSDLSLGSVLLFPIDDKESRDKGQDLVSKNPVHAYCPASAVAQEFVRIATSVPPIGWLQPEKHNSSVAGDNMTPWGSSQCCFCFYSLYIQITALPPPISPLQVPSLTSPFPYYLLPFSPEKGSPPLGTNSPWDI